MSHTEWNERRTSSLKRECKSFFWPFTYYTSIICCMQFNWQIKVAVKIKLLLKHSNAQSETKVCNTISGKIWVASGLDPPNEWQKKKKLSWNSRGTTHNSLLAGCHCCHSGTYLQILLPAVSCKCSYLFNKQEKRTREVYTCYHSDIQ